MKNTIDSYSLEIVEDFCIQGHPKSTANKCARQKKIDSASNGPYSYMASFCLSCKQFPGPLQFCKCYTRQWNNNIVRIAVVASRCLDGPQLSLKHLYKS